MFPFHRPVLVAIFFTLTIALADQIVLERPKESEFHPSSYTKTIAKCSAFNRKTNTSLEIDISYVDVNPGAANTLLFVHGWPSLWSTWSNQILAFKDDYHLLIPDLRGFGESTHPGDVESSGTMGDIVGDLTCILNNAGVKSAICVGHDWGASVCFEGARSRPEFFEAVVGVTVPYLPAAAPFAPIQDFLGIFPSFSYQVFFQTQTDEAIAHLNKDIRRALRSVYRTIDLPPPRSFLTSTSTFLDAYDGEIEPSTLFSPEEEDYLVEQYSIQGFDNTLQFYTHTNRFASHAFSHGQGNWTISQPVLSIYPTEDPVADWVMVENLVQSKRFLKQSQVELIRAQHWPQMEAPVEFNRLLKGWLEELKSSRQGHIADEL